MFDVLEHDEKLLVCSLMDQQKAMGTGYVDCLLTRHTAHSHSKAETSNMIALVVFAALLCAATNVSAETVVERLALNGDMFGGIAVQGVQFKGTQATGILMYSYALTST
jgi:hypothetical protein